MTDNQQRAEQVSENPPQPGLRFLELTVYIMGGLLVIMLVVLLGGIAWKVARGKPPEEPKASLVEIPTPAGSTIAGVTLDGNTMAVQVVSGSSHEVIVLDTRKGTILSRVRLKPETP